MHRALAVGLGILSGVVVAGIVAAPLSAFLPPTMRGAGVLWAVMAFAVAVMVWAFWSFANRRRG